MKMYKRSRVLTVLLLSLTVGASGQQQELRKGWRMISDNDITDVGAITSDTSYDDRAWYPVSSIPATVLAVLEENGVYPDLFFGRNIEDVPDLTTQNWWYRTEFKAPPGHKQYWLNIRGISYRAEVFLNGKQIGAHKRGQGLPDIIGQYRHFRLNVTSQINPGEMNALAIKIYPENRNGVELAESWPDNGSHVKDRSAGIWLPIFLETSGDVQIRHPLANTDLPLPSTAQADIWVYCDLVNGSSNPVTGTLYGTIKKSGKQTIVFEQDVTLGAHETREVSFTPDEYRQLNDLENPDLWWPYTMGKPELYGLELEFKTGGIRSDLNQSSFGIREVTRGIVPEGKTGNQWLKINNEKFLIQGACIFPDLLFRMGEEKERLLIAYTKDLGLNLLRWEAKMGSETYYHLADREGIPSVYGWMCCAQWERWPRWDDEDHYVARESLRDQLKDLRGRASTFQWLHGSDGTPPADVLNDYKAIAESVHFQNPTADNAWGDGSVMLGPYSWAPPYYWFNDNTDVDPDATSYTLCWEQGSNEIVPPFETLVKYMPSDHLWPVDTWWAFHASTWGGGVDLSNARNAIDARFGIPAGAEEFCKKAQVLNYESNRAQMESIASRGWAKRKGSVYWQLNSHYPGTFAHLVDYYYKQGGAYYGAKKGLRQLNVTYDYNAKGDRSMARIYAVNQTMAPLNNLEVQVKIYDLDINEMYSNTVTGIHLGALSEEEVMQIPRVPGLTTTFFVRCWLRDTSGNILAENFYWDSTQPDKIKAYYEVDTEFEQFADLTGLNRLASVDLDVTSTLSVSNEAHTHAIQITNNSDALAFFVRAEITRGADGEEVLPVFYSDNYISIFPKETHTIYAEYKSSDLDGNTPFIRIEGYNVNKLISHSGE